MKLLTQAMLGKLPPLGSTDGQWDDAIVQCKFFTPWSNWTWYCLEYSPEDQVFFGLVYEFEVELGEFSLEQLESCVGPAGLKIERDLHFKPCKLSEIRKNNGRS